MAGLFCSRKAGLFQVPSKPDYSNFPYGRSILSPPRPDYSKSPQGRIILIKFTKLFLMGSLFINFSGKYNIWKKIYSNRFWLNSKLKVINRHIIFVSSFRTIAIRSMLWKCERVTTDIFQNCKFPSNLRLDINLHKNRKERGDVIVSPLWPTSWFIKPIRTRAHTYIPTPAKNQISRCSRLL